MLTFSIEVISLFFKAARNGVMLSRSSSNVVDIMIKYFDNQIINIGLYCRSKEDNFFYQGAFYKLHNTINNEDFSREAKEASCAFTRKGKFSFQDLVIFILCFNKSGIQVEIDRFFKSTCSQKENIITYTKLHSAERSTISYLSNLPLPSILEHSKAQTNQRVRQPESRWSTMSATI